MRWLAAPLLLVVLSGCLQSQTSVEGPEDCVIFCSEKTTTVHYDWVPPVLAVLFVILLIGVIVAAVSGGRDEGQQQQVVIQVDRDGEVQQR